MGIDNITEVGLHKLILENTSTAILLFSEQLKLDYLNANGEILLEASAKRLTGMAMSELLPSSTNLPLMAEKSLSSYEPFTEREVKLSLRYRPQVPLTVSCVMTPFSDQNGAVKLLIELNRIDRSLRISREENQLKQNDAIRALARAMAHEIKNPLGGLRGAAQLLERELESDGLKEYTAIIIEEADRLRNLVNRLLGPNTLPQSRRINIHEITEHVRQLVQIEAKHTIDIQTDYDPSIPELFADRDQLIQSILNIIANAAQAIDINGRIVIQTRSIRKLTIGATLHKLVCQIDVSDNGPGVPEDIINYIFFPMVTTRAEGTGLGLSIAQSLLQQNGGLIQCFSEPGNTLFRILIPIAEGEQT